MSAESGEHTRPRVLSQSVSDLRRLAAMFCKKKEFAMAGRHRQHARRVRSLEGIRDHTPPLVKKVSRSSRVSDYFVQAFQRLRTGLV